MPSKFYKYQGLGNDFIILDGRNYDFEYIKQNAAISVSYDSIEKTVLHLITNSDFRNEISENARAFTKKLEIVVFLSWSKPPIGCVSVVCVMDIRFPKELLLHCFFRCF